MIDKTVIKLKELNLEINETKSALIDFSNNDQPLQLYINGKTISETNSHKFLGVTINKTLNFSYHIKEVTAISRKKIDILRYLTNKKWGAHPQTMLNIYKALVRSKLDYASSVFGGSPKYLLNMLNTTHLHGIRTAMTCLKSTPTNSLLSEAGETPLNIRREFLAQKEVLNIFINNLPNKKFLLNSLTVTNIKKTGFIEQQTIQIKEIIKQVQVNKEEFFTKSQNLQIVKDVIFNGKTIIKNNYSDSCPK